MPEGVITALRAQERDSQRVNVFIDDTFAIGVSLDTLAAEGLYVGKPIDAVTWARLEATEQTAQAFQRALRFLQGRPRSTAEVRQRLRRAAYADATIEAVIARLTELALLDDAEFARLWIAHRQHHNPRGTALLRVELRQKGLDREVIEAALAAAQEHTDYPDEARQARQLALDVLPRYGNAPDKATFERRLGGYLHRRGFAFATIRPILAELWQQCHPE